MTALEMTFNNKMLDCQMCMPCFIFIGMNSSINLMGQSKRGKKKAVAYMSSPRCPNKMQFPKNEIFLYDISFSYWKHKICFSLTQSFTSCLIIIT